MTQVIKSYLRCQEKKNSTHTNTHSRADLYPCRQLVEIDSLPLSSSSARVPQCTRTEPTSPTTSAMHKKVLFLIFLAFWQKEEPEVSWVKEMLSNQKSLPFLAARLPAVAEQWLDWMREGLDAYRRCTGGQRFMHTNVKTNRNREPLENSLTPSLLFLSKNSLDI